MKLKKTKKQKRRDRFFRNIEKMIWLFLIPLIILGIGNPAFAFTPPTEEYTADGNDVLLVHFNEADGSTTPDDASDLNHTITNNGNVQTDDGQTYFTNTSLFDGTGDYWSLPDNACWDFGTGDFTIDFWMRPSSLPSHGTYWGIVDNGGYAAGVEIYYYHETTEANRVLGYYLKNQYSQSNWVPAVNTWYHLAFTRTSGTTRIYIDGTQVGEDATRAGDITGLATTFNIGLSAIFTPAFIGNIDEFRVSDVARDWAAPAVGQFIMITWKQEIMIKKWWKNLVWKFKG